MSRRLTPADLQNALPDVTSTLNLPGLEKPVAICRDRWGVPHLRAASEHDAFFAQGFVTAQDRLWHMDYDRHRALGRWAEFAGPGALPEDRLMRCFRVERAARMDVKVTSRAAQDMLAAYSAGVNAFLASTRTLPVEYTLLQATPEPWEPWHCLAVYKVRNMLMGDVRDEAVAAAADPRAGRGAGRDAVPGVSAGQPGDRAAGRNVRRAAAVMPRRAGRCCRRLQLAGRGGRG